MDCSPPGSSVHGILQARILEWVAIFFSIVKQLSSNLKKFICFFLKKKKKKAMANDLNNST